MAFTELNPELEELLRELQDERLACRSIDDFVKGKLSDAMERTDATSGPKSSPEAGLSYSELYDAYMVLVDCGYLRCEPSIASRITPVRATPDYVFTGLTSDGRSYFKTKSDLEERRKRERSSDRRFQYKVAIVSVLLSGVVAFAVSALVNYLWPSSAELPANSEVRYDAYREGHHGDQGEVGGYPAHVSPAGGLFAGRAS